MTSGAGCASLGLLQPAFDPRKQPMASISFTVNGRSVEIAADGDAPLLDILRNNLGLIGERFRCGLEHWVVFESPGRVAVPTGRVAIGQGVLTAMAQIAAEELDVALGRIDLRTGDTAKTPNEGYTAGSQSIQFGGIALRLACAEIRSLFLDHAASQLGHARAELSVDDGAILYRGQPIGQDYWSLAASVDLAREATGRSPIKKASEHRIVGHNLPRVDLADKVFGGAAFLHDRTLDGMVHARIVRQPRRGATIRTIDEAAIRRAAKGPIEIVRDRNFLAILREDETTG